MEATVPLLRQTAHVCRQGREFAAFFALKAMLRGDAAPATSRFTPADGERVAFAALHSPFGNPARPTMAAKLVVRRLYHAMPALTGELRP
jgi:hypothetical protein